MKILHNIDLGKKSTIGIGGDARYYCEAKREGDLMNAKNFADKNGLGVFFFGIGSNILFSEDITDKLVCRIKNNFFEKITPLSSGATAKDPGSNNSPYNTTMDSSLHSVSLGMTKEKNSKSQKEFGYFKVGSGTVLGNLINILTRENFDLTPLAGFPSTIGGAISGNAGLCGREMKDYLVSANVLNLETGKFEEWKNENFKFGYRTSKMKGKNDFIISDCVLKIPKSSENLKEKLTENLISRAEKQPKGRSAGSFFKNPEGDFAGKLIEEVGLKGKKIGGAYFSGKHANFLMTKEGVEIKDILKLKNLAQKKVEEKFGVKLEEEIIII